ncbi:MAG TPA: hypothetical protein VM008_08020 [Phycisphaerae bacterium]|nr:hypothetical protein [Phycisphaerae bacterium]
MNELHTIHVLLANGTSHTLQIEVATTPPWKLVVSGQGFDRKEFTGRDTFEALIALRREIEREGGRLLCNGARPDVRPSGMSRSMGGGRKAYILQLGRTTTLKSLVDIIGHAEKDQVGTVEEQMEFHQKWFQSLKQQ